MTQRKKRSVYFDLLPSPWGPIPPPFLRFGVPGGSPSRGGDVAVNGFDINQPSTPTPFYSVLVSVSVFVALSPVFDSINSLDNSQLSHSVLLVLFCFIGPFNCISL